MKRAFGLLLLLLLAGIASVSADPVVSSRPHEEAVGLYARALGLLGRNTVDTRRQALRLLEEATLLEPDDATYQLTLARAYYATGYLRNARRRFEAVARLQPGDVSGHMGLGLVWRRDWLKYLDPGSLSSAVAQFSTAARLDSTRTDAWLMLAPLLVVEGDQAAAWDAAAAALRSDSRRLEARLAVAHALYRAGRVSESDSLYRATIPRLARRLRERFEDISPVATEDDTVTLHHLPAARQAGFVERFWRGLDPDLSTPENEAQLEYWARVTQAYFLFFDPKRGGWDERGEVYVRYGPPLEMRYNPVGGRLAWAFGTGPDFPANLMVWSYPDLGMTVTLQDRTLSEYYMLPVSLTDDMDPRPDPDSLARLADALGTKSGRGVFHLLPPGTRPLPLDALVARFEGAAGPRLLAQLETPGGPADSLWADWVVVDTAGAVRARATQTLAPSACAASVRRAGDFTAELAPGTYVLGVTVHDGNGRRGILRQTVELAPARSTLGLSDLVLSCGPPEVGGGAAVRVLPNPGGRVPGTGPLTAYFEIYHLLPAADGLARFEYVTAVRSAAKDTRHWIAKFFSPTPAPLTSVSREERHLGALRRQFITVPVAALAPGRYRLEITVRDLTAGTEATRRVEFVKTD